MNKQWSRRSFLKSNGVASSAVLVTGCSILGSEEQGLVLGDMSVRNARSGSYTVRVELERDGEHVVEKTIEFDGEGVDLINATWPADPAIYKVSFVAFGPDVEPDIHTRMLTADDREDDHDCTVVSFDIPPEESTFSSPSITVSTPVALPGNCPR